MIIWYKNREIIIQEETPGIGVSAIFGSKTWNLSVIGCHQQEWFHLETVIVRS